MIDTKKNEVGHSECPCDSLTTPHAVRYGKFTAELEIHQYTGSPCLENL